MGKLLLVTGIYTNDQDANRACEGNNNAVVAVSPTGLIFLADKYDNGARV